MDLTSEVFTSVLSPLAAFLPPKTNTHTTSDPTRTATTDTGSDAKLQPTTPPISGAPSSPSENLTKWQTSAINPQSRLDSLAPLPSSSSPESEDWDTHWQIDGADATGTRFYATPHFALDKPPLRVDVYLPPAEFWPGWLREVVKPEEAIYRHGEVGRLSVGRWLGRMLSEWAGGLLQEGDGEREKAEGEGVGDDEKGENTIQRVEKEKWKGLEKKWWELPFGSFISVSISLDNHNLNPAELVRLVPDYKVEQGMLPLRTLQKMWEADSLSWDGVAVVEWERLRFKRQVHEVISLVAVDNGPDPDTDDEKLVVFKAVLNPQEQRYMYNELKMLLLLGQHANVISRPLGVITKRGRFGNRRGVCGFLLEWYPLGSLRERLLRDDYCVSTSMEQRFRWARQVARALAHVNGLERVGLYPDLKPDNIVLREDADTGMLDAVLIDLEQRGGWFAWSPPEVAYVEYLEIVASDSTLPEDGVRNEITEQLRTYYGDPDWSPGDSGRQRYYNAEGGFSQPWLALLEQRTAGGKGRDLLERAQLFMLGKLLWCIFEGQPMVRCGIDHEVLRDADPDYQSKRSGKVKAFPEFKETPTVLRPLIRACTAGAPEWEDGHAQRLPGVVLRQGKLYPAVAEGDVGTLAAEDTRDAARRFWGHQLARARELMQELLLFQGGTSQEEEHEQSTDLHGPNSRSGLVAHVRGRPLLSEVLTELERLEEVSSSREAMIK